MSILVTLGNINLSTFENVCYAVDTVYPGDVDTLLVFDTLESIADGLESKRNQSVRRIFPNIQIRSQVVKEAELQTIIPLTLAKLLREVSTTDVIIDLTNGQKAGTSVLYAVATISRIERIHSLEIKDKRNLGKSLLDLKYQEDWNYTKLQPLKEIDAVAQHSYLELLYYQEEVRLATTVVQDHHREFAQHAARLLTQALEDYFAGRADETRYDRSVATVGILCEDIAKALYRYCKRSKKIQAEVFDFAGYINQIQRVLERLRSRKVNWEEEGHFGQQMVHILPIDLLLRTTAALRNFTAHPTPYKCRKEEARLMLDIALLMLKRLGETDVLKAR